MPSRISSWTIFQPLFFIQIEATLGDAISYRVLGFIIIYMKSWQGHIQKFLKEGAQSYKILERGGTKSLKMAFWMPISVIFLRPV